MMISLEPRLTLYEPQPMTESALPRSAAWLSEHPGILDHVDSDAFRDPLDHLLVSVCPRWLKPCLNFYYRGGPALIEEATEVQLQAMDRKILAFLRSLHRLLRTAAKDKLHTKEEYDEGGIRCRN